MALTLNHLLSTSISKSLVHTFLSVVSKDTISINAHPWILCTAQYRLEFDTYGMACLDV